MAYEYKDQHLCAEIAEALILKNMQTTGHQISVIAKSLLDFHLKKGGLDLEDDIFGWQQNIIAESALKNCEKKAQASSIFHNRTEYWRIAEPKQWIFGRGKHWVYLYYFSQDETDANTKGESVWRCKIGKTDGFDTNGNLKLNAPETRVKSQTRGSPEAPILSLLFRTDLHNTLERAIHAILELQGKHLPQAQGEEWFQTNPHEVVNIVARIDFGLLSPILDVGAVLRDIKRI